ncbi:MAG: protein kinase [Verrucomicrobia bacterium]|nr:protein kinase [Verrucomicrobiota bacterium]
MSGSVVATSASAAPACVSCGRALGTGGLQAQCPSCLLGLAGDWLFGQEAEVTPPLEPGRSRVFGDYDLIEELARGGMGVVYRARQRSLQREVALKMVLGAELADRDTQRRLQREAHAAASLHHPNIVPIYEIGEHELQPFYTMRLVPGGQSIADWAVHHRRDQRAIATVTATIARAVAHAHERGVLHRDLKPSNVLWDAEAGPQITDFGLAKRLDDGPHSSLSRTGDILGSPSYMAPEQAQGHGAEVTTVTDVYGLGAILYELLTGSPPFRAPTSMATMQQALHQAPERPSRRMPGLDRDLETICLKCLEKNPEHRYASARELAEELERCSRGEPIRARRVSGFVHLWRWLWRNPGIAAALAAAFLALLLGIATTAWQWRKAEFARRGEAEARGEAMNTVSDLYARNGFAAGREGDPSRAALWFAKAAEASSEPLRRELNRLRFQSWHQEAPQVVRTFEAGARHFTMLHWSADQSALLVQNPAPDPQATVWELADERRWRPDLRWSAAAWFPDGKTLAAVDETSLRILDYPSGATRASRKLPFSPRSVSVSADGQRIALGGPEAAVWEPARDRLLRLPALPEGTGDVRVELSRDGRLALLVAPRWAGVCALEQSERFLFAPVSCLGESGAVLLGEGGRLAVLTAPARLHVLDAMTGRPLQPPLELSTTLNHKPDRILAASPDGRLVALPQFGLIELGVGAHDYPRHTNHYYGCEFTADGRWFLSASTDQTVRMTALPRGTPSEVVGWHQEEAVAVSLSPDGRLLATAQRGGGLVRIWRRPQPVARQEIPTSGATHLAASADGQWLMPSGWTGTDAVAETTRVYRAADASPAGPEIGAGGILMAAVFAPEANAVVLASSTTPQRLTETFATTFGSGHVQTWDFRRGERVGQPIDVGVEPRGLALSPDGRRLAIYGAGRSVYEVDRASGQVRTLRAPAVFVGPYESSNAFCAYSPDGSLIVAWGRGHPPFVWSVTRNQPMEIEALRRSNTWNVAFLGDLMATVSREAEIDFTRVHDGQPAVPPIQDTNWLFFSEFSPSGDLFLTGGRSKSARLWDWRKGRLHVPALSAPDELFCGLFLPGTPYVVTGCRDGRLYFWDSRSGQLARSPLEVRGYVKGLKLVAGGRRLAINRQQGSSDNGIILTELAPLLAEPSLNDREAVQLAELDAAAEARGGDLDSLNAQRWLERWRDFRARRPDWPR